MNRTQTTWRERWNGYWENQHAFQYQSVGYLVGLIAGTVTAIFKFGLIGFLVTMLGLIGINLFNGSLKYHRCLTAFFAGSLFAFLAGLGHKQADIDPVVSNGMILGALVLTCCLVVFSNHGKPIEARVQRGLEVLMRGVAVSFCLAIVLICIRQNVPWYISMLGQMFCLMSLNVGVAYAGGWEPVLPDVLLGRNPKHRLETQ